MSKLPKNFTKYLSPKANRRHISPLRKLYAYTRNDPKLISLGGGFPNSDLFPFGKFSAHVVQPGTSFQMNKVALSEISIDRSKKEVSGIESLQDFLQYGGGAGAASLIKFFYQHMKDIHNPKYQDWGVISSVGSTDALNKVTELFLNDGDPILIDEWSYPTAIETFTSSGFQMVAVKMDSEGMTPSSLDEVCTNWNGSRPLRVVYMIPTGHNPAGCTMSLTRRHEIYKVCQKHDIIIIEDDPYYFLQFNDAPVVNPEQETEEYLKHLPGTEKLVPSILSIDTDGRVLRLDTFSKILAPNMRLGWITGQKDLLQKIENHVGTTTMHPCGFAQGIASVLLNDSWGPQGFIKHVLYLQEEYLSRRNIVMSAVNEHLGNMVSVTTPVGGMFLWLKVNLPPHNANKPGVMAEIFEEMIKNKVMLVPGWQFAPALDTSAVKDAPYFRAAFSYASKEQLTMAIERLSAVLERFGCKK
ncbi:hypothetical protein BB560_003110 [Smittium megazygosporum]|uniref:Aminotransferase class I/classII large domain-containing protein n=1 Tax=Smittium megazygosporum TaxID=133381 RepID=A0A2T9ZCY7_9FUNG|nr:hypothetical protein BB560_003110 [Smittium megazygosporum]